MIVVRVELHSAITGKTTEIARAVVCNVGGSVQRGEYLALALRGRKRVETKDMKEQHVMRRGKVHSYPRKSKHVFCLVVRALRAMGYE